MEFLRVLCRIIFKLFVPTKVFYPEKMPEKGPVIVISNHETMLDMFMIGYRVKTRYIKWMAKDSLFKFKPFGKLLRKWGAYPVKRGSRDTESYRTTENLLKSGEAVGIFPQGTRSRGRGLSLGAKPGFVKFALETDATVVPVAIWGKRGKIRFLGKAYVRFGEPFRPSDILQGELAGDREAIRKLATESLENIYKMMEVPVENNKG